MLRVKYDIIFAQNKKPIKSSPCSIKIDLTSLYLKGYDEFCTLVLEQD